MKLSSSPNGWFSEFHPPLNANVLFSQVFFESHPVYDQTQGPNSGFWCCVFLTLRITLLPKKKVSFVFWKFGRLLLREIELARPNFLSEIWLLKLFWYYS
jgi:hypothetical protein